MPPRPSQPPADPNASGDLEARIRQLVADAGVPHDARLVSRLVTEALGMGTDGADRLDLKIATRTLTELREAVRVFGPYRDVRKVAIFGSARTRPDEPAYACARDVAAALAARDWMIITGGGPGIMTAGVEGAGRERSFGVTIDLPFEPSDSNPLHGDPKNVSFRYFFNRKLTFMKEASGYVLLPGGFGTMDEAFELLTLVQTGRETPSPVVLVEPAGDAYWRSFRHFLDVELADAGLIDAEDLDLFHITSDVDDACDHISGFFRVFHSMRYVDGRLVIRLMREIDDPAIEELSERFADILTAGRIERCEVSAAELADRDEVDRPRLTLQFGRHHHGRLHAFVRALNEY